MTTARPTVAMIGLGNMGAPIARNLIKAGFALRVHNRTAAKAEPLVALGATAAGSPAEAAQGAEIVVANLLDDASMLRLLQAEDGLLAGMEPNAVHVCTTTISPACAVRLGELHREAGQRFVAAPVIGRPPAAEAGTLISIAAGTPGAVADARPVIDAYSSQVLEPGDDPAAAYTMKLAVNFFVISIVDLYGQVFAFAEKGGVAPDAMKELLGHMLGHPALVEYLKRVHEQRFGDAGFQATTGLKDLGLMLERAAELRAPLPYASIVRDHLLSAVANGGQDLDWSVVAGVVRSQAGLGGAIGLGGEAR